MTTTQIVSQSRSRTPRCWTTQLHRIRMHAKRLRTLNGRLLRDAALAMREDEQRSPGGSVNEMLALAVEGMRRAQGVELYDVQLIAAIATANGSIAQMQTGEGKTFSVVPAAVVSALQGNSVHVATPNSYLAERDFALMQPVFDAIGISTGSLEDAQETPESKRAVYDCEITYGTGCEFGFDYLRDVSEMQNARPSPLGVRLLSELRGDSRADASTIQNRHAMAIIDEVDNVLLDDAGSPLILCDKPQGIAPDASAWILSQEIVKTLTLNDHFQCDGADSMHLTRNGTERIHSPDVPIPVDQLHRPWSEYVLQTLKATYVYRRGVHYIVDAQSIGIVDGTTGRIFSDRTWNDGLQQAVEAKEGLPISAERSVMAQVTRQRYFRMYQSLAGMTGTALGCEREFRAVYNLAVCIVPLRLTCRRRHLPNRAFADAAAKWTAIADETDAIHRSGQPILIGTRSIIDSYTMANLLRDRRLPFQLLNGLQNANEAGIIADAGSKGAITIATNMAGRGTDIQLSPEVKNLGGLHVIVSAPNELQRVDRQLVGRCARQGDRGSTQTFVSADDDLIQLHGPWLERPIRRCASSGGELAVDISRQLRAIQASVERKQAAARLLLVKRDLTRDSLLSPIDHDL